MNSGYQSVICLIYAKTKKTLSVKITVCPDISSLGNTRICVIGKSLDEKINTTVMSVR